MGRRRRPASAPAFQCVGDARRRALPFDARQHRNWTLAIAGAGPQRVLELLEPLQRPKGVEGAVRSGRALHGSGIAAAASGCGNRVPLLVSARRHDRIARTDRGHPLGARGVYRPARLHEPLSGNRDVLQHAGRWSVHRSLSGVRAPARHPMGGIVPQLVGSLARKRDRSRRSLLSTGDVLEGRVSGDGCRPASLCTRGLLPLPFRPATGCPDGVEHEARAARTFPHRGRDRGGCRHRFLRKISAPSRNPASTSGFACLTGKIRWR